MFDRLDLRQLTLASVVYPCRPEAVAMMYEYGWGMMGFGAGHWLTFAVLVAVVIFPVGRILDRAGFSPLWSVLAFIPVVNLIALWLFAYADWPKLPSKS
jgi:hypothetical protein